MRGWPRPPTCRCDAFDLVDRIMGGREYAHDRKEAAESDRQRFRREDETRKDILLKIGWKGVVTMATVPDLIAKLRQAEPRLADVVDAAHKAFTSGERDRLEAERKYHADQVDRLDLELHRLDGKAPEPSTAKTSGRTPKVSGEPTERSSRGGFREAILDTMRAAGTNMAAREVAQRMLDDGYEDPKGRDVKKLASAIGQALCMQKQHFKKHPDGGYVPAKGA